MKIQHWQCGHVWLLIDEDEMRSLGYETKEDAWIEAGVHMKELKRTERLQRQSNLLQYLTLNDGCCN